ncbi:unnamed protein product [Mytilus coruscus]|uniref:SGNH hydrolase-type esterase domain-containing protein n=1 Tax=Mytilus coruscus TaxID=42192 RepID=A0A6J8AQP1_MYTCO|nr:unnamed protein product [Mytilus coruscus]
MFPKRFHSSLQVQQRNLEKAKCRQHEENFQNHRTRQEPYVSRTATGSNLSIASGPVINIVADAHQDAPFVPFRIQGEMDIESPNCNEENALDRPGGALLPLTPQPGPSGVKSPANNNLGMLTVSNEFVSHGSAGSGSLDTRLQVDQSPPYISSVFDPISSHIPVKIKEKIWNGEFIDLNILLKSTRDLVNEQNLEGELVVKGGVLSIVNQKRSPIKSYTHLYSLGNSPINVDEVKKALINYPHQEVAQDLIQGLEAGFKLKYSGPRLPMDIDSKEMNGEKATIARDKIFKEINLGSKAIWFVGSSIVYWAQTNAKTRNGGPNIGIQSRGVYIRWFGKRGMLWNEFNAKVSHAVDKFSPPAMIVIQLGSNDLVKVKTLELIQNIERDILRLHLLLPNTRIVWSEMLMRRYWHDAKDGKAIERSRKRVNSSINNFVLNDGHCVIQHPNIRAREMNLYRFDGTHLSDIGYDIYLNNIQRGIETFLSSHKIRRFPEV